MHLFLLLLFITLTIGYVFRLTFFRKAIIRHCGQLDVINEIAHLSCAVLMIPMVISPWAHSVTIRNVAIGTALVWAGFFIVRISTKDFKWGNVTHAAVFFGTALMYFLHSQHSSVGPLLSFLSWVSGVFYICFSVYYAEKFWAVLLEKSGNHRTIMLQSELSHVIIGFVMFGMVFRPDVFMA